jgi:hypothetical protein
MVTPVLVDNDIIYYIFLPRKIPVVNGKNQGSSNSPFQLMATFIPGTRGLAAGKKARLGRADAKSPAFFPAATLVAWAADRSVQIRLQNC